MNEQAPLHCDLSIYIYGIYLPAPASVSFDIIPPEEAIFKAKLILIPPEAADPAVRPAARRASTLAGCSLTAQGHEQILSPGIVVL